MAMKAIIASLDGLPDALKEHYREEDGKFILDVTPVDGFALDNPSQLKSSLQNARAERDKFKNQLKTFEGLDAEAARAAIEKLEEIGDPDKLEGDMKSKYDAAMSTLQKKFDEDKRRLEEGHKKVTEELNGKVGKLSSTLSSSLITSTAGSAIQKAGGVASLLLPIVERHVKVEEVDGKFEIRVVSPDGTVRLSNKAGSMDPMSVEEFVNGLKDSEEYSRAFDAPNASGSGATNSARTQGSGARAYSISAADAKDTFKYRAAKEAAEKAGVELQMTQ